MATDLEKKKKAAYMRKWMKERKEKDPEGHKKMIARQNKWRRKNRDYSKE